MDNVYLMMNIIKIKIKEMLLELIKTKIIKKLEHIIVKIYNNKSIIINHNIKIHNKKPKIEKLIFK